MSEHVLGNRPDASLSAMYQETLLAHHRTPHNRRELVGATHSASRRNPLCGDAIEVAVLVADGRVAESAFTGRGCSIAVASASMMTDVLSGRSLADALTLVTAVEAMVTGAHRDIVLPDALDALRGVAPFPGRHACASMPWLALRDALTGRS